MLDRPDHPSFIKISYPNGCGQLPYMENVLLKQQIYLKSYNL